MIDSLTQKEKILAVAKEEFGKYGYKLASTNRIYPKAGVSKGLIFKIFKSKANLFYNLFSASLEKMLSEMKAAKLDEELDIIKKISDITSWKIAYANRHPLEMKIMLEAISNSPKEIKDLVATHIQDLLNLSLNGYFTQIDMSNFREEYSREDVVKYLTLASKGVQAVYLDSLHTMNDYDNVRNEILDFYNTILRGMRK